MIQEDKELLFIDLCNRIPYKTICTSKRFDKSVLVGMDDDGATFSHVDSLGQTTYELLDIIEFDVKPYLRPMSSMTEEEKHELLRFGTVNIDKDNNVINVCCVGFLNHAKVQDYLNSIHIDFRGLIPKGLAIEVNKENNPYKE